MPAMEILVILSTFLLLLYLSPFPSLFPLSPIAPQSQESSKDHQPNR